MPRCPGQDLRYWTPKDIYDIACISCGTMIEFWKDEPSRICPGCKREVRNPRIDLGCAKWCRFAAECIGKAQGAEPVPPVIDRLELLLEGRFGAGISSRLRKFYELAGNFLSGEKAQPCIVQASAVLAGALIDAQTGPADHRDEILAMLERAGIEPQTCETIFTLIDAVLSGGVTDSPEYNILTDIINLDKARSTGTVGLTFKTVTGQTLAARLSSNKPKETPAS